MLVKDVQPLKRMPRNPTQDASRLTREEVRVLTYYRVLSDTDREALRCLLYAARQVDPA